MPGTLVPYACDHVVAECRSRAVLHPGLYTWAKGSSSIQGVQIGAVVWALFMETAMTAVRAYIDIRWLATGTFSRLLYA